MNHDILEECKELYLSGCSLSKISSIYNIERHTISYELKNVGIITRENGRKYNIKLDAFEKIDNELSSYWLGFLYADGNVSNKAKSYIDLSLGGRDLDHLNKFRDWISPGAPVKERLMKLTSTGKEYLSYRLLIPSVKLTNDIIKLGCIPNKTFALKFPSQEQVPHEYINHFMRGYFDGDGCASSKRFSILGNYEFINEYSSIMHSIGVSNGNIRKHGNIFIWERTKKSDLNTIYRFLYNNSTLYLERKHEQLKQSINDCPSY